MTAPTAVVVLATGDRDDIHLMANSCLASGLAWSDATWRWCVFTDRPERYRALESRIEILAADAAELSAGMGPQRFYFRLKFTAMRRLAAHAPNHQLLYLDGDTAAVAPLAPLAQRLATQAIMHQRETTLGAMRRSSQRGLRQGLLGRTVAGIHLRADTAMWNAGVVGLGVDQHGLIAAGEHFVDEAFARGCAHTLVEQFGWSAVLAHHGPLAAATEFAHYWGNKGPWQEAFARRWSTWAQRAVPLDDLLEHLRRDPIALPAVVRRRKWQQTLARLAGYVP